MGTDKTSGSTAGRVETAEAYIAGQPEAFQRTLRELRALIQSEVTEAQERISYGVIVYRLHTDLVGLGVTKRACSFYTMSPDLMARMVDDLGSVKRSGATLHLPPGEPLPDVLLRMIVRARVRANEERAGF